MGVCGERLVSLDDVGLEDGVIGFGGAVGPAVGVGVVVVCGCLLLLAKV